MSGALTAAQMRACEQQAAQAGLPTLQMMENAGRASAQVLMEHRPDLKTAAVFCGRGNNGGDALVVARQLREKGVGVLLILAQGRPATPDALTNLYLAARLDIPLVAGSTLTPDDHRFILGADAVVDGIYGTGFHGELPLDASICTGLFSRAEGLRMALDLPTGVECDTGRADSDAARAQLTVAYHAEKPCHRLAPAYCGQVVVADIGLGAFLPRR